MKEKACGSYELERKATFFVLKTFLNNQAIERVKREFLSVRLKKRRAMKINLLFNQDIHFFLINAPNVLNLNLKILLSFHNLKIYPKI